MLCEIGGLCQSIEWRSDYCKSPFETSRFEESLCFQFGLCGREWSVVFLFPLLHHCDSAFADVYVFCLCTATAAALKSKKGGDDKFHSDVEDGRRLGSALD